MDLIRLVLYLIKLSRRFWRSYVVTYGNDSWPIAQGTVFDGQVAVDELGRWVSRLSYSYSTSGEYYSGIYERGFHRKKKAEAFLERFPRGLSIPVRHKPERPSVSTLNIEDLRLFLIGL